MNRSLYSIIVIVMTDARHAILLGKHCRDLRAMLFGNWLPVMKPVESEGVEPSKRAKFRGG